MSQSLIAVLVNSWLVVATLLFLAIVVSVFRPSSRRKMQEHALIPFENDGDRP